MNENSKRYLQEFKLYIEVEKNFSKHTVCAYSSDILSFLVWLNERDIEEVNYTNIKEYLLYIQQFNYTKTTTARKIASLRTFYRFLYREKIIDTNPALGVHAPKKGKSLPEFLTENEIEQVLNNIKMDAAINELMLRKTASAFSKDVHVGTDALIRIEQQKGFPDLGELFIKGIVKLDDILKLRNDFQGKIFRYWAQRTNYEEQLMRQEIMNSVHNILGSKCMNPIRFIGTNLIGLLGFIPGLAASAFDSFILDKISKGWHPNFFLDDKLKKMIDDCIAEEHRRNQRKKLNEAFKDVGRNDPCPCGSGKKYKKCHGKDL